MLSLLTEKDEALFRHYVEKYAQSGECYITSSMTDTSYLLRHWASNKATLLRPLFGGDKLILEREIAYKKEQRQISSEIALHQVYEHFRNIFIPAVEMEFGKRTNMYYACRALLDPDGLAENTCRIGAAVKGTFRNGHTLTIANGAKPMRLLGKICKELDLTEEFENFRLMHSMCLNQKKLKGTFCLSIHPLDYLTMSDNAHNWHSCMSWSGDGDYRMGTVEMMNSPYVVVGYLKSDNETFCGWNSKLWRCLYIVHPDIIVSIKGYPYYNEQLAKTGATWLRDLAKQNLSWHFSAPCQKIYPGSPTEFQKETYIFEFTTNRMYNDFECSTHWGYINDNIKDARVDIYYSGTPECMICGQTNDDGFLEDNFVVCENCCDTYYNHHCTCDNCGHTVHEDEVYWVDDTPLCECCYSESADCCAFSDEYKWNENLASVYFARRADAPNPDTDVSIKIGLEYVHQNSLYYTTPAWLSTYFLRPPRYDHQAKVYYWNKEDVTVQGAAFYFFINDVENYN